MADLDMKNDLLNNPDINDDDKFLFFFTPHKIEKECAFGLSLKTGVRIFSFIVFYEALQSLSVFFNTTSYWRSLVELSFCLIYILIGSLALYSTFNENVMFAKISYVVVCILFIFELLFYCYKFTVRIIDFINPWDVDFLDLTNLAYIVGKLIYIFVYLYFIYILYCYIYNMK